MKLIYCIYGACWGSFICLAANRLVTSQSIVTPRSFCDACHRTLQWWQLIPIFGYFLQGGRCHFCREKIQIDSSIVELLFAILFLCYSTRTIFDQALLLIFFSGLIIMALTDIAENVILTPFLLIVIPGYFGFHTQRLAMASTLTLLITVIFFYILNVITHGIGTGDIELIVVFQIVFGLLSSILIIMFASLTAILFFIIIKPHKVIPFVPFLVFGCLMVQLPFVAAFVHPF